MPRPWWDRRSRSGAKLDYSTSIRPEEPRWKRIMKREGMGCFVSLHFRLYLLLYTQVLRIWSEHFFDTWLGTSSANLTIVASGFILHYSLLHCVCLIFRGEPPLRLVPEDKRRLSLSYFKLLLLVDTTILCIGPLLLPDTLPRINTPPVAGLLLTLFDILHLVSSCWRELLWWLHTELRFCHARACTAIFNWKTVCATFAKKLSTRTTNRRYDELKHFKWTCVSLHTLGRIQSMWCGA